MRVPPVLRSRFVVVPLVLALVIGGWNIYVLQNDHGRIAGLVVDTAGNPISGATVVLFERQFSNQVELAHTLTDSDGRFRFAGNRSHVIALQAHLNDGRASPRTMVRLWFRAQDRVLSRPLTIAGR